MVSTAAYHYSGHGVMRRAIDLAIDAAADPLALDADCWRNGDEPGPFQRLFSQWVGRVAQNAISNKPEMLRGSRQSHLTAEQIA